MASIPNAIEQALVTARPYIEQYGLPAMAGALFAETMILTSFWFPGMWFAVVGGFLVAGGELAAGPAVAALLFGALLGDIASFGLGRVLGLGAFRRWRRIHGVLVRLLADRPDALVLTGHFAPFVRPFVSAVAGSVRFSFARWMVLNAIGTTVWLATLFLAGVLARRSMGEANTTLLLAEGFGMFVTLVVGWLVVRALRKDMREAEVPREQE